MGWKRNGEERYNSRIGSRGQSVLVVETSKVICFIRNYSMAPASEATSYFVLEPCGEEGCIGKDLYVGARTKDYAAYVCLLTHSLPN